MMNTVFLPLLHPHYNIYPFFRLGGYGLGNLLFPYFRCLLKSIEYRAILLHPAFFQFQPNQWRHRQSSHSSRTYSYNLLSHNPIHLSRLSSLIYFYTRTWQDEDSLGSHHSIIFTGLKDHFYDLIEHRDFIRNFLNQTTSSLDIPLFKPAALHLRLGDFTNVLPIPSQTTVHDSLEYLIDVYGTVTVFSDCSPSETTSRYNLEKYNSKISFDTGDPLNALLSMSRHSCLVGSHFSSYFEWGRFLANPNTPSFTLINTLHQSRYHSVLTPLSYSPCPWRVL